MGNGDIPRVCPHRPGVRSIPAPQSPCREATPLASPGSGRSRLAKRSATSGPQPPPAGAMAIPGPTRAPARSRRADSKPGSRRTGRVQKEAPDSRTAPSGVRHTRRFPRAMAGSTEKAPMFHVKHGAATGAGRGNVSPGDLHRPYQRKSRQPETPKSCLRHRASPAPVRSPALLARQEKTLESLAEQISCAPGITLRQALPVGGCFT
jgi:hypothetical protein